MRISNEDLAIGAGLAVVGFVTGYISKKCVDTYKAKKATKVLSEKTTTDLDAALKGAETITQPA